MSSANICCKSITISSTKHGTKKHQSRRLTTYKTNSEVNGKPSYVSSDNNTLLYYSDQNENWRAGTKETTRIGIKSDRGKHYACPSDAKDWQYFYKYKYETWTSSGWVDDSTLAVTCNQEQPTATTARATLSSSTTTSTTTDSVPKLVIIGASVGGGVSVLLLVVIIVCVQRNWKSRQSGQNDVDDNPVYGVYADVYEETEIYDRNAYYAATDMEDSGTTMIRDNNSEYE